MVTFPKDVQTLVILQRERELHHQTPNSAPAFLANAKNALWSEMSQCGSNMIQSQLLEYIYNLLWLSCPVQLSIAICLAMLTSFNFIQLSVGFKISAQNVHRTCVRTWVEVGVGEKSTIFQ